MTLSKSEQLCKWTILALLIFSVVAPAPIIIKLDLIQTHYAFNAILFFLLLAAGMQGIVGLVAWVMICFDKVAGKKLLISTYLTTLAAYGAYTLYLHIMALLPNTIVYPLEIFSITSLFVISAAILLMQHFWTRYIF